jgi:hypothetical protein
MSKHQLMALSAIVLVAPHIDPVFAKWAALALGIGAIALEIMEKLS